MNSMPCAPTAPAHTLTRREALAWLARAAALGCVLPGACAWAGEGDAQAPTLANLMALRNESAKLIANHRVILVRTSKGLAAFANVCTHKRQELEVDKDGGIFCPVHGSRFDLQGKPTNGPASRGLKWFKVQVEESGAVLVDTSQAVEAGAWAELPAWAMPKKPGK